MYSHRLLLELSLPSCSRHASFPFEGRVPFEGVTGVRAFDYWQHIRLRNTSSADRCVGSSSGFREEKKCPSMLILSRLIASINDFTTGKTDS